MTSEEQFTALIEQSRRLIFKVIRLYVDDREDEKDLYQEIVFQAWRSYSNFQGNSKFSTWLYRVSLNTVLTFKRKIRQHQDIDELRDHPVSNATSDDVDLLYSAIRALREVDRMIIMLHLDGYNNDEIAEFSGISRNHVAVKLHRIKNELGQKLKTL